MRILSSTAIAMAVALATLVSTHAQTLDPIDAVRNYNDGVVGQFDGLGGLGESATVTTRFTTATADRPALLLITAKIATGKHTYSLTQPAGGPLPTKIELQPSSAYRLLAPFRSEPAPHARVETGPVWTGLKMEEHEGEVTWYAPIEVTAGVDPKKLEIRGEIHMQVCDTACEPVDKEFIAREATSADVGNIKLDDWPIPSAIGHPHSSVASFQFKGSAVKFSGRLEPSTARPGESAVLRITATMPKNGHIYALADRDQGVGTKPVLIALQSTSGLLPRRATTDAQPKIDNSVPQFGEMKYHDGSVTWTMRIDVPKEASAGDYPLVGIVGYQMCETGGPGQSVCELPRAVRFAATLKVGPAAATTDTPLTFAPAENYGKAAAAAATFADHFARQSPNREDRTLTSTKIQSEERNTPAIGAADTYELDKINLQDARPGSLSYYIALAFVGGLILNLMPCVLPVIGLKVMSFVEQAGKSRAHAFALNVWFAAGIVAVFLVLGLLAATIGLSWGGQFGSTAFNVTTAAVVFAMALSLLGVWEVPIPGFFGSGSVQSAASQEGPLGAFLKGVVTTVLATPCTAPLMAAAIAWAVTQPLATNLIVFASVGLGMASPYLLVGVYPELLRFLPKPGPWMETFKQISGFVLLGTVVFILSFVEPAAVVPTVLLLLGIGVACWVISRTPLTAEVGERIKSWVTAGVLVLLFVGASFGIMYRLATMPIDRGWQPYSLERLKQVAVDEGRTVLVDFSAEWCFNCKLFEKTVLHTRPVEQAIKNSSAVTMYADYTDYPQEITDTLKALGANGVPVIAIFPGDAPYEPFVFRGGYRQQDLVAALERATGRKAKAGGPSIAEASAAVPARN